MSLLPWIWRSLPLQHQTGSDVFAALFLQDDIATLLESPYPASPDYPQLGRFSICAGQPRANRVWTPEIGEILPFLDRLIQPSSSEAPEHLPFTGGWLGWLGYDLAWEIERLPYLKDETLPFPVAFWYEPECFAVLDHEQQTLWLAASNKHQLDQLEKQLSNSVQTSLKSSAFQTRFCMEQADYEAIVLKAKQHIRAGDIFQANLSLRFEARTEADSWAIYRSLQSINPSPFASYWKTPWGDVISCSPERLVKLENGIAQTRPIAGTRPRGTTPEHDRQLAQELLENTKEQAEHIMLVDLERNDLGRVCEWGTVQVDELLVVEHYSHVMHLVSNVVGKVRPEFNSVDVIRALFPGGTITGCPKVRCMEIIETLEPVRRSLFYGSCGYVDRRGNLDLNILIRTLLYAKAGDNAIVWGQVGAGIIADSDPEREWFESLQKARAQLAALGQNS
ncbi:anthranilate synthase component I-like protein [Leptolyngbya sp. NIES-3755]|nr:anthranilate synthase component I-like protein [Leptolyngbya sp. NIES-3755]